MEIFECESKAYFNFFSNSQKENWKFAFVNVALVGLSNFFPVHEIDEILIVKC